MNPFQSLYPAEAAYSPTPLAPTVPTAPVPYVPSVPEPDYSRGILASLNPEVTNNKFYQFFDENRSAISALGRSMIGARTPGDFADNLGRYLDPAAEQDRARLQSRKDEQARLAGLKNTADMAERYGRTDIADWVRQGLITPQQAFAEVARSRNEQGNVDQFGFPESSANSQKMRALLMQGIDTQTALGIVSGRYELRTDPLTGTTSVVDMANQSISPLNGQTTQPGQVFGSPQGQGGSLWDIAEDATGFGSSAANLTSNTLGQLPGALGEAATFPAQVQAQQEFNLFKRDLIRSLSLNPRFPVAEQQRIENIIPTGALVAPETLKTSLMALDRELIRIEQDVTQSLQNPNTPVQQRQADLQTLRSVQAARQRLGIPSEQNSNASPIQWEIVE